MTSYWVQVAVERPAGLPDLDDLQMRGVGALLAEALEGIAEILGPSDEHVSLDDYRIATYPQGTFVSLDLDAPDLTTAEDAAGSVVSQIIEDAEPLRDWSITSSEVQLHDDEVAESLAAAEGPDAPSSDLSLRAAALAARGEVLTQEDVERFRAVVTASAPQLAAFALDVFGPAVGRDTAELAAGALVYCIDLLIDELFEDLETLHDAGGVSVADLGDAFLLLNSLPPSAAAQYDEAFVKRFIVAATSVTGRLTTAGWDRPGCVAEELALRLLVEEVEPVLDMYGLYDDALIAAYAAFYDVAFDDARHELLYDPPLDGARPPDVSGWFTPFGPDRNVHPYAFSSPDEGPL